MILMNRRKIALLQATVNAMIFFCPTHACASEESSQDPLFDRPKNSRQHLNKKDQEICEDGDDRYFICNRPGCHSDEFGLDYVFDLNNAHAHRDALNKKGSYFIRLGCFLNAFDSSSVLHPEEYLEGQKYRHINIYKYISLAVRKNIHDKIAKKDFEKVAQSVHFWIKHQGNAVILSEVLNIEVSIMFSDFMVFLEALAEKGDIKGYVDFMLEKYKCVLPFRIENLEVAASDINFQDQAPTGCHQPGLTKRLSCCSTEEISRIFHKYKSDKCVNSALTCILLHALEIDDVSEEHVKHVLPADMFNYTEFLSADIIISLFRKQAIPFECLRKFILFPGVLSVILEMVNMKIEGILHLVHFKEELEDICMWIREIVRSEKYMFGFKNSYKIGMQQIKRWIEISLEHEELKIYLHHFLEKYRTLVFFQLENIVVYHSSVYDSGKNLHFEKSLNDCTWDEIRDVFKKYKSETNPEFNRVLALVLLHSKNMESIPEFYITHILVKSFAEQIDFFTLPEFLDLLGTGVIPPQVLYEECSKLYGGLLEPSERIESSRSASIFRYFNSYLKKTPPRAALNLSSAQIKFLIPAAILITRLKERTLHTQLERLRYKRRIFAKIIDSLDYNVDVIMQFNLAMDVFTMYLQGAWLTALYPEEDEELPSSKLDAKGSLEEASNRFLKSFISALSHDNFVMAIKAFSSDGRFTSLYAGYNLIIANIIYDELIIRLKDNASYFTCIDFFYKLKYFNHMHGKMPWLFKYIQNMPKDIMERHMDTFITKIFQGTCSKDWRDMHSDFILRLLPYVKEPEYESIARTLRAVAR